MTDPNLDTIINLVISSSVQTPTRPGFGVALLLASQVPASWGPNLVRSFGSIDEVIAAGFVSTNEARLMANVYFGQNPRPSQLKIAKRTNVPTKKLTITVNATVAIGNVYSFLINGVVVTYTAVDTLPATVATAINAAITAPTGYSSAVATNTVTLTALAAGTSPVVQVTQGDVKLKDTTVDPGTSANLDAIRAEDGDWYGLMIDIEGSATITAAAAWAQPLGVAYGYETYDTECSDPAITNDILSNMTLLGYDHVWGAYSHKQTNARIQAGMMGRLFPYDPGTENWAFKNLTGVAVQTLSSAQFNAVDTKRGNMYVRVQGSAMTWQGKNHSTWIDSTRAGDYTQATVKIDFFEVFLNNNKVPFTDFGGDILYNALDATFTALENAGVLDAARGHSIIIPKIASMTVAQRQTRVWSGIKFTAYYTGAVNKAQISGTITP